MNHRPYTRTLLLIFLLAIFANPTSAANSNKSLWRQFKSAVIHRDLAKARQKLSLLAKQKDPKASFLLADFYRTGKGGPRNDKKAFAHMKKSARAGYVKAWFGIGKMLLAGQGTGPDKLLALKWLKQASRHGNRSARFLLKKISRQKNITRQPVSSKTANTLKKNPLSRSGLRSDLAVFLAGRPPLLEAVRRARAKLTGRLIAKGADITIRDRQGNSLLMVAAINKSAPIFFGLLESGADVHVTNHNGKNALMLAAANGQTRMVQRLLERQSNVSAHDKRGFSALDHALANEHGEVAKIFLGLKNSGTTTKSLHLLVSHCCSASLLGLFLKRFRFDINTHDENGRTMLWFAASAGNVAAAKLLLENKANPNQSGNDGSTPLMAASLTDNAEIARLLIAHGADLDRRSKTGNTALHLAAMRGASDITGLLIKAGGGLDEKNKLGNTALMLAASAGRSKMAKTLIKAGAATSLRNAKRETASQIAISAGFINLGKRMR